MEIRQERDIDIDTIRELTHTAFKDQAFSDQTEAQIIDTLRQQGALTLSLVAVLDDAIVGHIAFSPVTINDKQSEWYGLGPVSVWPQQQKRGIGQSLIRDGLRRLKDLGAKGCVLLGDPGYYNRFGFVNDADLIYVGAPAIYFQRLVFIPPAPKGDVKYHAAFDVQ